jgi:hypothetical protein
MKRREKSEKRKKEKNEGKKEIFHHRSEKEEL